GFAVVASEVRNLAESSQVAAQEIDKVSKKSVEVADNSSELLKGLLPHIDETLKRVQEISSASKEQQSGINQVNGALIALTNTIQENSSAAEQLSTSSEELHHQSDKLLQSIKFFKVKEEEKDDAINEIEEQIEKLKLLLNRRKLDKGLNVDLSEPEPVQIVEETQNENNEKPKEETKLSDGLNINLDDKDRNMDDYVKF
ncbi:MAG: methyl-accepting chemotaxis protein, partial [Bacteroidales bacterium]|nr:methyl-accepting chemotaxis protein [Bacteroidales bacterium]